MQNNIELYGYPKDADLWSTTEVRAVRVDEIDGEVSHFTLAQDSEADFFSVYVVADGIRWCIADCSTRELAEGMAKLANDLVGYSTQY